MRDSVKSILLWNLSSEFSVAVASALAASGYRLLLVGDNSEQLDEVDATLAQSELHRLRPQAEARDLDAWVRSQAVGMDHAVLFPEPPSSPTTWPPAGTWNAQLDRCFVQPLEVIRTLRPLLNRGKKPKHLVIAFQWLELFTSSTAFDRTLRTTWAHAGRELATELAPLETAVNLLWFGPLATQETQTEMARRAKLQDLPLDVYRRQLLSHLPLRSLPGPDEAAALLQRALETTSRCFTGNWVDLTGDGIASPTSPEL